mmetsp:Transcript_49605/g.129358  ORF Transcript_49605/g.129358 Transcript_49605/m.129358 type:complete len:245 (+) Transcript_49605:218-952(+)
MEGDDIAAAGPVRSASAQVHANLPRSPSRPEPTSLFPTEARASPCLCNCRAEGPLDGESLELCRALYLVQRLIHGALGCDDEPYASGLGAQGLEARAHVGRGLKVRVLKGRGLEVLGLAQTGVALVVCALAGQPLEMGAALVRRLEGRIGADDEDRRDLTGGISSSSVRSIFTTFRAPELGMFAPSLEAESLRPSSCSTRRSRPISRFSSLSLCSIRNSAARPSICSYSCHSRGIKATRPAAAP